MEILNDKFVGLKMPLWFWEELKRQAEQEGFCTGSYIRAILYKALGLKNPETSTIAR